LEFGIAHTSYGGGNGGNIGVAAAIFLAGG